MFTLNRYYCREYIQNYSVKKNHNLANIAKLTANLVDSKTLLFKAIKLQFLNV